MTTPTSEKLCGSGLAAQLASEAPAGRPPRSRLCAARRPRAAASRQMWLEPASGFPIIPPPQTEMEPAKGPLRTAVLFEGHPFRFHSRFPKSSGSQATQTSKLCRSP